MAYSYSMGVQPLVNNIVDAIEDIVARVPATREGKAEDPATAARTLARKAAARAAALSGALALPPGVLGLMTVLPDLVAIWRIQAQMVADIAGLYGKEMQLTRSHMLYCLFRHAASQLTRDVAVRAGDRDRTAEAGGRKRRADVRAGAGDHWAALRILSRRQADAGRLRRRTEGRQARRSRAHHGERTENLRTGRRDQGDAHR